jgi:isocitrate dehydrogenase (NAD+)
MKFSDGLFLHVAQQVAKDYPEIEFNDRIIDNMCMQLMQRPEAYDVLVMPNLYGDVVSDLTSGMIGGLGVAPGANIGTEAAVFEAIHGSAPSHAGKDEANPTAMILTGVMMLRHLGEQAAAKRVEDATAAVIAEGQEITYDLRQDRDTTKAAGTTAMTDAIIARL